VVEGAIELIYRARPKGITDIRAVEGDANTAFVCAVVIGDIGEIFKPLNHAPMLGIKER
jgi:predicted HD phosphohydrolase